MLSLFLIFTCRPDFNAEKLHECIWKYQNRDRRYGGVKEMKQRVITAIVLVVLFLPCVIVSGIPF